MGSREREEEPHGAPNVWTSELWPRVQHRGLDGHPWVLQVRGEAGPGLWMEEGSDGHGDTKMGEVGLGAQPRRGAGPAAFPLHLIPAFKVCWAERLHLL